MENEMFEKETELHLTEMIFVLKKVKQLLQKDIPCGLSFSEAELNTLETFCFANIPSIIRNSTFYTEKYKIQKL